MALNPFLESRFRILRRGEIFFEERFPKMVNKNLCNVKAVIKIKSPYKSFAAISK